jgi:hypothetical protein
MEKSVEQMLVVIDEPNREPAETLWNDLKAHVPKAWGSGKSHQAWDYGYRDHIQEVMNLAHILYERMEKERRLPFSLGSAALVLFLHDCEKPFKRANDDELANFPWVTERPGKSDKDFQRQLIAHYGFELSGDEWNGLKYVEGENEDYINGERVQGPLAAFCHACDTISARVWHDYPKHDPQTLEKAPPRE